MTERRASVERSIYSRLRDSRLFKDGFWALTGSVFGRGLSLISSIAIARFMGSEAYGEYGMIKESLLMIAIFSSFGLGYTATKFIAEIKDSQPERIAGIYRICMLVTLVSSVAVGLFVAMFSTQVAGWLKAPELGDMLRWSAIAVVLNAVVTTQVGVLGGFMAYKVIARNIVKYGIFTFVASVPLAYYWGLTGAVVALIASLLFHSLINAIEIKRRMPKGSGLMQSAEIKRIMSYSLPVALQESTYSITTWVGMAMLVLLTDYTELGLLSSAGQWYAVIIFVPGALRNVALSHFSESSADVEISKSISKKLMAVNFCSTFIPFVLIALLSGLIASFYGPTFVNLPPVLNICIFTAVISSLSNVVTNNLMARNQNWFLFSLRLFKDVSSLCIAYVLISYGLSGAISVVVSKLIMQSVYLASIWVKQHRMYALILP